MAKTEKRKLHDLRDLRPTKRGEVVHDPFDERGLVGRGGRFAFCRKCKRYLVAKYALWAECLPPEPVVRRRPTQAEITRAEVHVELEAYARVESAKGDVTYLAPSGHSIPQHHVKHPPWRSRRKDGRLGGWFGPTSPHAYDTLRSRYSSSFHAVAIREEAAAGGLWDYERQPWESSPCYEARCRGEMRTLSPAAIADERLVLAFYESGEHLPDQELLVAALHFHMRFSRQVTARRMGISVDTMREYAENVRARARLWAANTATPPAQPGSGWDEPPT